MVLFICTYFVIPTFQVTCGGEGTDTLVMNRFGPGLSGGGVEQLELPACLSIQTNVYSITRRGSHGAQRAMLALIRAEAQRLAAR